MKERVGVCVSVLGVHHVCFGSKDCRAGRSVRRFRHSGKGSPEKLWTQSKLQKDREALKCEESTVVWMKNREGFKVRKR